MHGYTPYPYEARWGQTGRTTMQEKVVYMYQNRASEVIEGDTDVEVAEDGGILPNMISNG